MFCRYSVIQGQHVTNCHRMSQTLNKDSLTFWHRSVVKDKKFVEYQGVEYVTEWRIKTCGYENEAVSAKLEHD